MTLWNYNTHTHTQNSTRHPHFYSLCLVPTQGKVWPFLILTSVHLLPPFVYFHDHLQFMSSFSHCVLLWQDNSISLIQYALCLYLHAPVTVPLVREGVVFLSLSFSHFLWGFISSFCIWAYFKQHSHPHHTKLHIWDFCLIIFSGSLPAVRCGENTESRGIVHAFTNQPAKCTTIPP